MPGAELIDCSHSARWVDQIFVHRLDRLSRSVRHCVTLLDEFRHLEVGLVIVSTPELAHSAQDNFMLNIMASFAEFEREIIAARIAESRAQLEARHLRFAGGVPFGYDSNRRTRQLVPNEETAVIRWMFAEAAAGSNHHRHPKKPIASGYRTKATNRRCGGAWTALQIVATLRNPVHVGMLRYGDGIRLGSRDRIISFELFESFAKAPDDRRTRNARIKLWRDVAVERENLLWNLRPSTDNA